ncbi:MAG: orotate phosphoribosyltransferase [Magnetococcales bacterium]|nr:orotate phosphoribosyltransferase [Magnetococcales bacterium]
MPGDNAPAFLRFSLECEVLRFGRFRTKAGRDSPYFFNAGLFRDGRSMARLGRYYAEALLAAAIPFDMLFGPAYKGIPLVVATAIGLQDRSGKAVPFAFNRKEEKDHGEGGGMIGAPLAGRVMIVDDVISAGISVAESAGWIRAAGATLAGVVIALDRQERGQGQLGAVAEVSRDLGVPVVAIASLDDLVALLQTDPSLSARLPEIRAYRERYGA